MKSEEEIIHHMGSVIFDELAPLFNNHGLRKNDPKSFIRRSHGILNYLMGLQWVLNEK